MLLSRADGIFGDELVSAKDLNRQSGRILDIAFERPVTITRNNHYFALLRREDVTYLVQAARAVRLAFEVSGVAFRLMQGAEIGDENPYAWLSVFDKNELEEFTDEIASTIHRFENTPSVYQEVDAVVYEWRESAIVVGSSELAEAMQAESDDLVLDC
jgi:hypothetical protein